MAADSHEAPKLYKKTDKFGKDVKVYIGKTAY